MEAKKGQRRNVGREQHPVHDVKLRQSPFLNACTPSNRLRDWNALASVALNRGAGGGLRRRVSRHQRNHLGVPFVFAHGLVDP